MKIDFVIPYVDNKDKVWLQTYIDYFTKRKMPQKLVDLHTERYEDIGLINYQLKLVERNMQFINNVFLLLSNVEQKPKDLPSFVKVVLHKDFIPNKYLPTFNSTTIEMFLWNIQELGEYFIYANDDMLPCLPMSESDFFGNDKIKIRFSGENIKAKISTQFRLQCLNSFQHVADRLHIPHGKYNFIKPLHSFTPMRKSHCKECYSLLEDLILPNIRAYRTDYQHNQYIYPIYELLKYGTLDSTIDFHYTEVRLEEKIDLNHQIVCINKVPTRREKELKGELDKICK